MKIEINGDVSRSFLFPADASTALAFYSNLECMLDWLPHISLVQRYGENQFRMLFHSTELGIYQVRIFCDLEAEPDFAAQVLSVRPLDGKAKMIPRADLHSLSAQGLYASESHFRADGDQTHVHYHLKLQASLPIPLAARFIFPKRVAEFIAHSIMVHRMNEIAEGFIERSLETYRRQITVH